MISGFEWATPSDADVWCIRRVGEDLMLCGRLFTGASQRASSTNSQSPTRRPRCRQCQDIFYGRRLDRVVDPVVYGVCPVCDRWEAVADGVMQDHGGWAVGAQGPHETGRPCPGVGSAPEVEQ